MQFKGVMNIYFQKLGLVEKKCGNMGLIYQVHFQSFKSLYSERGSRLNSPRQASVDIKQETNVNTTAIPSQKEERRV